MSRQRIVQLVFVAVFIAFFAVWMVPLLFRGNTSSIDELLNRALHGEDASVRETATVELVRRGWEARDALRRVLSEADSPSVRAASIRGLGEMYDYDSMPTILDALDDPSSWVRGRANIAASRMLGRSHGFDPDASAIEREKIVVQMRQDWESLEGSELLESFRKKLQRDRSVPP